MRTRCFICADLDCVLRDLGFVQVDSVNTLARAHDLILWTRRGQYRPKALERLVSLRCRRAMFRCWAKYPYSSTNWNHRPLGVQIWALAYRSGEAWNEFGYSNPEFDAVLEKALATADVEARRALMAEGQAILQNDAVTIQPYWRSLYRHAKPGIVGWDMHIAYLPQMYKVAFAA